MRQIAHIGTRAPAVIPTDPAIAAAIVETMVICVLSPKFNIFLQSDRYFLSFVHKNRRNSCLNLSQ
jgi:hypothetical protein